MTPRYLELQISARCNLRCRYCSFFDSDNETARELTTDAWHAVLREAGELRVLRVKFGGAEPLLRADLEELVTAAVENRMRFILITNGSLVTAERAAFFAATRRCDGIQISLDGPRGCHDAVRGNGAFDGALRGARLLREAGVPLWIRITVGRHNLGRLAETLELAKEDFGAVRASTEAIQTFRTSSKELDSLALSAPEYAAAIEEHLAALPRYRDFLATAQGPLRTLEHWRMLENSRRENREPLECRSCGKLLTQLAVRADGAFLPCGQHSEYVLGHAGKETLAEVWNGDALRKLRESVYVKPPQCAACEYRSWCGGKCPAADRPETICYRSFRKEGGVLKEEYLE